MKWHHSLYSRIALGFVACLALLLVVQAMLFVWVIARSGRTVPNQPPERLAQAIAVDVSSAFERDPSLDLAAYLRREYANDAQPFFVLLENQPPVEIGGPFERRQIDEARARLDVMRRMPPERLGRGRGVGPGGFGPPPLALGPPENPGGLGPLGRGAGARGGRGFGPVRPAPIVVAGALIGLVVVPPQPPFGFLLARYAPILGLVAVATLVIGAALATLVIFGPARARLRAVEDAASRLGAGDLSARAPEQGRDEVSAVAAAFNAMAADLSTRAAALAASDRARRQLLADVSHELTTPVTAIRGYLETLTMPELAPDPETRARYLGIITDETARLERIIGDLLDLARLEGGGGALVLADVSVEALFQRVVARHERAAAQAGVMLVVRVAPDAGTVRGDRDRLEQALQNLCANALRHAPTASSILLGARRAEIGADGNSPAAKGVVLFVEDRGAGIAQEHLPRVFDRFYKVEESRVRGGAITSGSGLGLSIVKAIVEQHGGHVAVRSEPGHSVFELTLTSA